MVVKKKPTSLKVDPELWEEVRIMAIRVHKNITTYFEDALREKLVKDYEVVAAEKKRKEQERLHNEQVKRQYEMIVGREPGRETEIESPHSLQQNQQPKAKSRELPEEEIQKIGDEISEEFEYDYQLTIPGLNFPIDKNGLLQIMREVQNEFNKRYNKVPLEVENALFLIEKLEPNKMYKGFSVLKNDLDVLVSDKKIVEKLIGIPERFPGCSVVHTDPISEWDDERWERRIKEDYEVRRRYQELKQQYKPQKGSLEYSVVLPGLKFPLTKNEIIERAKEFKYPKDDQETQETMKITINLLNQLPDDIYTSKNKLERDFSNILMHKLKNLREYEGRVITIVYDESVSPGEGQGQGQKQSSEAQLTKA